MKQGLRGWWAGCLSIRNVEGSIPRNWRPSGPPGLRTTRGRLGSRAGALLADGHHALSRSSIVGGPARCDLHRWKRRISIAFNAPERGQVSGLRSADSGSRSPNHRELQVKDLMTFGRVAFIILLCSAWPIEAQGPAQPPPLPTAPANIPSAGISITSGDPFQGSVASGQATSTPLALSLQDAIDRGLKANLGLRKRRRRLRPNVI